MRLSGPYDTASHCKSPPEIRLESFSNGSDNDDLILAIILKIGV
jgi:hypothetical protein